MKTVRRDKLMRMVAAGKMEAKCEGHYTDDYAADAANNFGKTEGWLPCRLKPEGERYSPEGVITLRPDHFEGKAGMAYETEPGVIMLAVHSNLHYTLREKKGE